MENELKSMEGVSIIRYLSGIDWVEVKITRKSIPFLGSADYINSVYIHDPDDVSEFAWVRQPEILRQIQMHEPFYVANDGNNEPDYFEGLLNNYPYEPDRVVVAVFDATGFNGDHVIFTDNPANANPPNIPRILKSWNCYGTSGNEDCYEYESDPTDIFVDTGSDTDHNGFDEICGGSVPYSLCNHGTKIAADLAGDLRDEQDSNYLDNNPTQRNLSGHSPEAYLMLFNTSLSNSSEVYANNLAVEEGVNLISLSQGNFQNCSGTSIRAAQVNTTYLNGILTVTAAGNGGHGTGGFCTGNCNVLSPADATSALTVGAIGDLGGYNNAVDLDNADAWNNCTVNPPGGSANGGHVYYSGRSRTIVDILAPGTHCDFPAVEFDDGPDGYEFWTCQTPATSHAQPKVASAIVNLISHQYDLTSQILLPGIQKVIMLGMGNRRNDDGSNSYNTGSGYDEIYGSGFLNMRRLDDYGLDNPANYDYGTVCVGQGDYVSIPINNGNTIPAGVDALKAVIWWYTDDGLYNYANDIDLRLYVGGNPFYVLRAQDMSDDLKKRVYYNNVAGNRARLQLVGTDVNFYHYDGYWCDHNDAEVYYFWIYEDNARDDAYPMNETNPASSNYINPI